MEDLLDRLDEATERVGRGARAAERHKLRMYDMRVIIAHPGGGLSHFIVCTRDVSANGMGFIHGGYLHPGTRCIFDVQRTAEQRGLPATIAHCLHIERGIHVVGARFDESIDPRIFLDAAAERAAKSVPAPTASLARSSAASAPATSAHPATRPAPTDAAAHTPPSPPAAPEPTTPLLIVTAQAASAALIGYHTKALPIIPSVARSLADAERAVIADPPPAVVLFDGSLAGADAAVVLQSLREAGFVGVAIALTAQPTPRRVQELLEAGVWNVAEKPCDPTKLVHLLSAAIVKAKLDRTMPAPAAFPRAATEPDDGGTIISTLAGEPGLRPLISSFIGHARRQGEALGAAARSDQRETVRQICHELKGAGGGFGFPGLSDAAARALAALESQTTRLEGLDEVREVESLCRRLAQPKAAA